MRSHVVHFTAPINSSSCGQLIDKCTQAIQQGADELVIKIATMGGECSYGFSLYNFLISLPVPVKTHNLGTVESMGNIIFWPVNSARRASTASSSSIPSTGPSTARWTIHACPNTP